MTPEEKAKQLIDSFNKITGDDFDIEKRVSRQCAIICVKEILFNNFWEETKSQQNYIEYWNNVLTALNTQNT